MYVEGCLADGGREHVGACWIMAIGKLCGRRVFRMWMTIFRNVTGVGKGFQDGFAGQWRCIVYDSCVRWGNSGPGVRFSSIVLMNIR